MWLTSEKAHELASEYGSPLYVYNATQLKERAGQLLDLNAPFGLTVRYAMKANPHPQIIKLFSETGLHFDASSSYEAFELLSQGIEGSKISLSSQQPPHDFAKLISAGVRYVATSFNQLEICSSLLPESMTLGLRVNPGFGSGQNNRFTTGGLASSFGLWHEQLPDALEYAKLNNITIDCLHVHIGTGADISIWGKAMDTALAIALNMPDVTTLDIGGGYKIAYTESEEEADLPQIVTAFSIKLEEFYKYTGRKLKLEIEPGRWLVAHSGELLTEIVDIVNTGSDGFTFLRTNTGMNDFLRPCMYGAQHKMRVLNDSREETDYVVVGHNCETGDILTPAPHDPEQIQPRRFNTAKISDLLAISDTGAYCASMCAIGYNAFPQAKEVFLNIG